MAVFEKTPKGQEEVKSKAHGLSMIERRVLIFIDGKRTLDDLKSLPRVTDLDGIIGLLQTEDYITQIEELTAKAPKNGTPPSDPPEQPNKPPEALQSDEDDLAETYLASSARSFW